MGKTYKDNKEKWKKNRDFQKKQSKKKGQKPYSPFDEPVEYHESIGGK